MQSSPNSTSQKGISLIELITVVCLISILTGIGMLSFGPLWEKHQLRSACTELKSKIQLYRMRAILENATIQLQLKDGWIYLRSKKDNQWSAWGVQKLKGDITYDHSGSIYFHQKGFASPKTITLTSKTYHQNIVLNINGRIRDSEIY